jgi:hypothetical protein
MSTRSAGSSRSRKCRVPVATVRMRFFNRQLASLVALAVTLGLALPANAQVPSPAAPAMGPSAAPPVCPPPHRLSEHVTWTFNAPNQTCEVHLKSPIPGTLTVEGVVDSMVSVDPLSGVPETAGSPPGIPFVVKSGTKSGSSDFRIRFSGSNKSATTLYIVFTIINQY